MTDPVPSNETLSELFGYVIDLSHDMDAYHSQKLMEVAGIIGGVIASRAPQEQRPSKDLSIRPITNATSEGLVERLRWKWADHGMGHNSDYTADLMASADEIERLREALAQLEDQLRLALDMDRAAHEPESAP